MGPIGGPVPTRYNADTDNAVGCGFEIGDAALVRLPGRVMRPGVLVALVPAGALLDVSRSCVDGRHDRARRRVGVLAAVDHAVAAGLADSERLGVGGWSYGGMLTNYVITRSTRFKAAVSGASISNYLAGYGTDHYQYWYEAELGLPWKQRQRWIDLSMPFFDIEKVTTPTLFMCGELDFNVPLLNSEQMYQALKSLGVETQLIIYPEQYHGLRRPSYLKDRMQRYLDWFGKYVKAPAT